MTAAERKVILASSLGTVFEWYDFYLYGSLAPLIAQQFFAGVNETAAFIFALMAFAAGFAVRPFGAIVFGRIGDLVGRKYTFLVTIVFMGGATFLVGLLPTFEAIGWLAPILLDLADKGFAHGFSMNGSATIHDYEIAVAGHSSEDVEAVLPDGSFGSAEETGRDLNDAINGAGDDIGMGEALSRKISELADPRYAPASLLCGAYSRKIPVTVHVAVGTDTPHTHPGANGAAIGRASHHDFRLLCEMLRGLDDGGVYLNVGSAVVMPEVFLKAVSVVRNLGYPLRNFTTVNFDFLQHYRPSVNVVKRPHANAGGKGYALTGHHEIMIPLLAAILVEAGQ